MIAARRSRGGRAAVVAVSAALVLMIVGCSSSAPPSQAGAPATRGDASSSTTTAPDAEPAGDAHGCTPGMLAFLADEAFADVPPVDPATFVFPNGIRIAATPTCYVYEDSGSGAGRAAAIFADDPQGVLTQAADAFAAAGWTGDPTVGVWWSNGDDPVSADFSVGGVPFDIDGRPCAWFAYALPE